MRRLERTMRNFIYFFLGCLVLLGCRRNQVGAPELAGTPKSTTQLQLTAARAVTPSASSATQTLFERLDPVACGIDFEHQWKPRDQYEAGLLKTGFTGGGVCLGDFDDDGLSDVLFTRPQGGTRLYRNEGDFRFRDVTEAAGVSCQGAWTTGAAFVDVDQDGRLDIVVCAYESENFVFLNRGDSRFEDVASKVGLGFSGASVKLSFADYDGDGDLDAYLLTNRREPRTEVKVRYLGSPGNYTVAPEHREQVMVLNLPNGEQRFAKAGQVDRLYKNELTETGTLRFRDVTSDAQLSGYYHGLDVIWWDFNRDSRPDLYVANDFTDPDQFYRNNGDGTFTDVTQTALPCTPWFAMGAACGDINNDGRFDLLATDMNGTSHYRQKMAMGSMDAVAWFLDTAEPRQYMRNALYLNSGTDRFLEIAQMAGLASSDWTWSVKLADLDNDGWEDVYATNGFTRDYLNSDFNLKLQADHRETDAMAWYEAPELKEVNLAFRNEHHLHFANVSEAWGVNDLGISFGASLGDLDGDGDLDLVVNNFAAPPSLYRNQSQANRLKVRLRGKTSNSRGVGATVELHAGGRSQIRYVSPQNGFMSANDTDVYFGLGDVGQIDELSVFWPSGRVQRLQSLKANQTLLIQESEGNDKAQRKLPKPHAALFRTVEACPAAKHEERPFDDFATQPLLPNKLSQLGPGLACGDFDADGDVDFYQGGAAGQSGQLLINRGDGQLLPSTPSCFAQDAECEDQGSIFFDADNDGDLDLYVASGGVEVGLEDHALQDRLYLNEGRDAQGDISWALAVDRLPLEQQSSSAVAAADFDHDGDLDLCVGTRVVPGQYPLSGPSRLLENKNGSFVNVTAERAPGLLTAGMVTGLLWSDANGDGQLDLLATCEYGPVRCFVNQGGNLSEHTEAAGLSSELGWWNSIVAADVDQDGDMDYAVGNFGLNTKYHPTPTTPQLVFFGDFAGDGVSQIVEAKSAADGLLPTRGRSCSSNAMPFLKERFTSFHSFASATLNEIYTEDKLAQAVRVSVNRVESVLLLNDGTAHFTIQPLPDLAQMAPVFGLQFIYANDDDQVDLLVTQNFHSPQRETGRMNGGLGALLLGNGDGSFREVWPDASGVQLPGDSKAASCVDLNGDHWQDLLVTTNNGTPFALMRDTPPSQPRWITLQFGDDSERQLQSGVIVHATYPDGKVLVAESSVGCGYLSQVPPQLALPHTNEMPIQQLNVTWPDGSRQTIVDVRVRDGFCVVAPEK